jgi:hypothetical protein
VGESVKKRWRFASDNDGHHYCIPADMGKRFDELLAKGDEDEFEAFNDEFEEYRASGSVELFTFTDPKED